MKRIFSRLSNKIIGAAIEVHKTLGPGLLESAYQQCLAYELRLSNLDFQSEAPLPFSYKGININCGYRIDLLVENQIILELKSIDQLKKIHEAQLLTYMKLLNIKQGFLINFNVILLKQGIKSFIL